MEFLKVQYPAFLLLYIYDILQIIKSQPKPIFFADNTTIIVYHPDSNSFKITLMMPSLTWTIGLKPVNSA
jgi:hypothetical protein